MHLVTATALVVSVLALSGSPAAATPACDEQTARTIHELESQAGPAGPAIHTLETVVCG